MLGVFVSATVLLGAVSAEARRPPARMDVAYVSGGRHDQQLDFYAPQTSGYPTVLYVHEGSLSSGDRKDQPYAEICKTLAKAGVGCAVMSYRLFPNVRWPAPAEDVAAAAFWLRSHLAEYGGDPERLFLVGHSSGGFLVSMVATDSSFLARYDLRPRQLAGVVVMGARLNDAVDTTGIAPERVRAHFERDPYDRQFGDLETRNRAVPAVLVGTHIPPFLVLVAESEQVDPPVLADAREFAARAGQFGRKVDVVVLPGRTHMSAMRRLIEAGDPSMRRILEFIAAN